MKKLSILGISIAFGLTGIAALNNPEFREKLDRMFEEKERQNEEALGEFRQVIKEAHKRAFERNMKEWLESNPDAFAKNSAK